jgi:hypothetical protein
MKRQLGVLAMVWAFTGCGSHPPETDEEKSDRVEREQLPEVRKMAEAGNAEAQYRMGLFAFLGKVVPQSTDEAILWWRKAADQNYLPAEHDLGVDYYDGKIVPQDLAEGIRWLRKAAEQGEETSGDFYYSFRHRRREIAPWNGLLVWQRRQKGLRRSCQVAPESR